MCTNKLLVAYFAPIGILARLRTFFHKRLSALFCLHQLAAILGYVSADLSGDVATRGLGLLLRNLLTNGFGNLLAFLLGHHLAFLARNGRALRLGNLLHQISANLVGDLSAFFLGHISAALTGNFLALLLGLVDRQLLTNLLERLFTLSAWHLVRHFLGYLFGNILALLLGYCPALAGRSVLGHLLSDNLTFGNRDGLANLSRNSLDHVGASLFGDVDANFSGNINRYLLGHFLAFGADYRATFLFFHWLANLTLNWTTGWSLGCTVRVTQSLISSLISSGSIITTT